MLSCYAGSTSFNLNTEVKKHLARTVLVWDTFGEFMVLLAWVRLLMLLIGRSGPPLVVVKYSRCQSHVKLLHRAQGTPVGKDHLGLGTMCFYSLNRVS